MLFSHSLTIYAEKFKNDVVSQNNNAKKRLNAFYTSTKRLFYDFLEYKVSYDIA